jgi:hypothetical protein
MSDQVPTRCEQLLAIALGRGRGGVRSDRRRLPERRKGTERRKRSEDELGQERRTGVDRRHAGRRLSDTQDRSVTVEPGLSRWNAPTMPLSRFC